jgi:signal peptidase I
MKEKSDWRQRLRENRAVAEAREKLENDKVRYVMRLLFEIAVTLAFAALVAIVMFQSVTMQESAMEPTISVGDKFFMNRAVYQLSDPKRGDIIVFKTNASDDAALHIRRIIGLPGETIQISGGQILIDGKTYREGKDFPAISNPGAAQNPITLESNEYFVLGDNRNNSEDSRYGDIGLVKKRYIVGKLWFTVSPMKKFGFMKG